MRCGVRRDLPDSQSSTQRESSANEANLSGVEQLKSYCESLFSLLSKFVPFVQSAAVVEHASSILYKHLLPSANGDHDQDTNHEVLEDFLDSSKSNSILQNVFEFDAGAQCRSAAEHRRPSHLAVKTSEELAETEIQSYQNALLSYENELNAAWRREADLYKELQSLRLTFRKDWLNDPASAFQVPAHPTISSSYPISNYDSLKKSILQADTVLIETKIPPSDSFLDDIFNLQAPQLFTLLSRQIAVHHDHLLEVTRLSKSNFLQDRISC